MSEEAKTNKPASAYDDANTAAAVAAEKIGDPALEEKLRELSPEQIELFVEALRQAMRKRKLMLVGYLSALLCVVLGLGWALFMYVTREPGTFVGWVFLVPFTLAATCMWIFGRLARRIKVRVGDIQLDADLNDSRAAKPAHGHARVVADRTPRKRVRARGKKTETSDSD